VLLDQPGLKLSGPITGDIDLEGTVLRNQRLAGIAIAAVIC